MAEDSEGKRGLEPEKKWLGMCKLRDHASAREPKKKNPKNYRTGHVLGGGATPKLDMYVSQKPEK